MTLPIAISTEDVEQVVEDYHLTYGMIGCRVFFNDIQIEHTFYANEATGEVDYHVEPLYSEHIAKHTGGTVRIEFLNEFVRFLFEQRFPASRHTQKLKEMQIVKLTQDYYIPIKAGTTGVIVDAAPDKDLYIVEFVDDNGYTIHLPTLHRAQIEPLPPLTQEELEASKEHAKEWMDLFMPKDNEVKD